VIKNIWFAHLTLTTLAALTPQDVEVKITDENVETDRLRRGRGSGGSDGNGDSCLTSLRDRSEVSTEGYPGCHGGPHASTCPQEAKEHVDAVVIGEAETVWPQVIDDVQKGCLKPFYKADAFCSMEGAPLPDSTFSVREAYMTVNCVQTTRGCPHRCDYCHVTHFFGKNLSLPACG